MVEIRLKIDDDVKKDAEQVCEDIGISMSTAINIYLKRLGKERRIPFEVKADIPNAETIRAMENVKNGIGMSKTFTSLEALMEDLNAED